MLPKALVTAFLMLLPLLSLGQNILVPSSGSDTIVLPAGSSRTILDAGGNGNYPVNCSGTLTLIAADHAVISLNGYHNTEYNFDFVKIFEGRSCNGTMLGSYSGIGPIDVMSETGVITILFTSNNNTQSSGFVLTASVCGITVGQPYNVTITDIGTNSALISWDDTTAADNWTIHYGPDIRHLDSIAYSTTPYIQLDNLQPYTNYVVQIFNGNGDTADICTSLAYRFKTICSYPPSPCIDYSDLSSCYVSGTYGTYQNPSLYSGIVDYGSASNLSHHTVHTDTAERDPRTDNLLRTVPLGYSSSVRLGNWSNGGEAESITFEYTVDTLKNDLLIMKYAAVLQEPGHEETRQPNFTFHILDNDMNDIDAVCYSANFIADSSLGWNISYDSNVASWQSGLVLWKDWTSIGIDLTPLHGQTILVKLTTRDCAINDHYGYAYFVFDCANKSLQSQNCGAETENTFTAPEGFAYRWFNVDNPDTTLSTEQSLHVTQGGIYKCTLSFIGAPDGANCSFDLTAMAGERYPAASFTIDTLDYIDCNLQVALHNTSRISSDSAHTLLTNLPCEETHWIIDGDSLTQSTLNLSLAPGQHNLSLVASLGGGNCSDTATIPFFVWNPCYRADTIIAAICEGESYTLFDTVVSTTGIYIRDSVYHHRTLILTVNPTNDTSVSIAITENQLPYTFLDATYTTAMLNTTQTFSEFNSLFSIPNSFGCDSTIHLNLLVRHNRHTFVDSTLCEGALPLEWNGVTFTTSDNATVIIPCTTPPYADSIITMVVNVLRNSNSTISDTIVQNQLPYSFLDTTYTTSMLTTDQPFSVFSSTFIIPNVLGCDSIINYNLLVWHNVACSVDSTVCEGALPLEWNGITFTSSGTNIVTLAGQHGKDSTLTMRLHVIPNSSSTISDTVVQNQLPYYYLDATYTTSMLDTTQTFSVFSSPFTIPNALGCDSIINFTLHVWNNLNTELSLTLCDNQFPYLWDDTTLNLPSHEFHTLTTSHWSPITVSRLLTSVNGADSLVVLTLRINSTYQLYDTAALCENQFPYIWGDTTITLPQESPFTANRSLSTVNGCDSTLHLTLIVYPIYNIESFDTICDNQFPYFWDDTTLTSANHQSLVIGHRRHITINGCDSLLTLNLTIHPTHRTLDEESVCDGAPYTWIDGNTYYYSTYEPTVEYTNHYGCDSIVQLILNLDQSFSASMQISPLVVTPEHPEVQLRDLSRSRSRQWLFGEGNDTARIAFISFPADADSLNVILIARSFAGCIDSVTGTVHCDLSTIWAPNAFTPDQPTNSRFFIPANDILAGEVLVYTRQGLLVTRFDLLTGSWDGTKDGTPLPQGTYTWVARYTTLAQPSNQHQAKSTVTLIR